MKKTLQNLVYQVIFQFSKIVIPLITVPIVSRALGPNGVGIYNYTNSVAQYVIILANLGIVLYGNRVIAQNRDSFEQRSKIFWELAILKILLTLSCLFFYLFFVSFLNDRIYFYIQGISILAVLFDISWFFMGLEDFRKVTMSSLLFQVIGLISIVMFVKTPSDLSLYIFIQCSSLLFGQFFAWIFLKNKIRFIVPKPKNMFIHLKASLPYFVPQVAVLLYTNLNKTILGIYTTNSDVAYYSNAQTINTMIISLVTTIDTVLLPRMTYLSLKNQKSKILEIMSVSIHLQFFVSIPAFIGLIAITPNMVPWFFGNKFLFLVKLIPLFAPLIFFVPLGMAISRQYLLPTGKINAYNNSVITGALISIVINILLIKPLGIYSAVIATISSEIFVCLKRVISLIKNENFKFQKLVIFKYFFSAAVMYLCIIILTKRFNLQNSFYTSFIQILFGAAVYLITTTLLKVNPFLSKKGFFNEKKE